jgi:hypothetical protein
MQRTKSWGPDGRWLPGAEPGASGEASVVPLLVRPAMGLTATAASRGAVASRLAVAASALPAAVSPSPPPDPPPRQARLLFDAREQLARGAVLLLFVVMMFLAGVFIGASFPSDRRQSSEPGGSLAPLSDPDAPGAVAVVGPRSPEAAGPQWPPTMVIATSVPQTPPASALASENDGVGLTAAEKRSLLVLGDARLREGDVTAARLLYRRGAVAGDGEAALHLGQSFDARFLRRARLRQVQGDLGLAVFWYRRAEELGNAAAGPSLRQTEIAARWRWSGGASPRQTHRARAEP